MIREQKVTCIVCPAGCEIIARVKKNRIIEINGNRCKKGAEYARSEVVEPKRVLTTTVRLEDGRPLPVKTAEPIPRELMFKAIKELKEVRVKVPVKMGEVVHQNVGGSNVDVISTRSWGE